MFGLQDLCVVFYYVVVFSSVSAEHQTSPGAEMGDTLEFNEIYQEVKGSWVSIFISGCFHDVLALIS